MQRRCAAMLVSAIILYEGPKGWWPNAIKDLCHNGLNNDDKFMKIGIVQCLSYLLEIYDKETLSDEERFQIISTILGNIDKDDIENTEIVVQAFTRVADLSGSFFKDINNAQAIMF